MSLESQEACWRNIAENWKEECYKLCFQEWNYISKNIVEVDKTRKYTKCSCGTIWTDTTLVCLYYGEGGTWKNLCPMCDDFCEPYLCNPRNKYLVEKYIPKKFHRYIFQNLCS